MTRLIMTIGLTFALLSSASAAFPPNISFQIT
jgi:hypothetical protein